MRSFAQATVPLLSVLPSVPLLAQTTAPPMPPNYRGVQTHISGIFVTPIPNAPFSADVQIVSHVPMPDGSQHVVMTTNHIARTSTGSIYNERRLLVPAGYKGTPRLLESHIYDPSSRQSIFINPALRLARQMILRAPVATPRTALPPGQQPRIPGVKETDLGTQTLDGVELQGTSKERLVPAALSGTGKDIVITDEYWYSPDLAIYMTIRHNDPRTGEQLVAVTHVERGEPPADLFAVPPEYKLVDETPPEAPPAAH